jgi:hypothetical protein
MSGDQTLELLLQFARNSSQEELPGFIGQLEQAKATAWARLAAGRETQQGHDELLDVTEAARRLGISKDYLYDHHPDYPFTRRQGRKLLFSAQGIDKHIRQNRA